MKLEAVDKKNMALTCVATVVDVLGDRILIHFDGWEEAYDYWCDPSSPYIHPVGWCQENGKPLSPPNGNNFITLLKLGKRFVLRYSRAFPLASIFHLWAYNLYQFPLMSIIFTNFGHSPTFYG